jgi:hypothetical protein
MASRSECNLRVKSYFGEMLRAFRGISVTRNIHLTQEYQLTTLASALLIIGIYFRCELVALRARYFKPESGIAGLIPHPNNNPGLVLIPVQ